MEYVRAHVDPIQKHMDPTAVLVDDGIVIAYGLAANDFIRLKGHFPQINKCGLLLVDRNDEKFRFLKFDEIVVIIYPGFRETLDSIGLTFGYDLKIEDISKRSDCIDMSRWLTLSDSEKLQADQAARTLTSALGKSRLLTVLGPKAIDVVEDLMWESSVFEPLHAATILAKAEPLKVDFSSLRENLKRTGADLRSMAESSNRILARKRRLKITLMDCAKFLFKPDNYFECQASKLARVLNVSADKLSSHFRGYLIVDDDYLKKLQQVTEPI
jgi:hypothetical protein